MRLRLKKFDGNPILSPVHCSYWESGQVRNPAAILHEGKVHMLYTARAEKEHGYIHLGHAVSTDGFHFERVSEHPAVSPSIREFGGFDAGAVEDARAVKIDDTYYITYVGRSVPWDAFHVRGVRRDDVPDTGGTWTENWRRGGLITSKDMVTFEKKGPITPEDRFDANLTLFPEKIGGKFVLLHRPSAGVPSKDDKQPGIAIAFSDDLVNWENDQGLAGPKFAWENAKIGGSNPPIKTDEGWLTLYHAVERGPVPGTEKRYQIYRIGVMLLDLEDPTKVLARASDYILEPTDGWERVGSVNNVVFPNGGVVLDDELFVYYGGADVVCCVATAKMKDLLDYVLQFRE